MEKLNNLLATQQFTEASIGSIVINLILCMILVSFVSWFYKKYSISLGGKTHIGSILPLIGLTVFLIITVVKSSLALSLGLVGALSIVRFRTPIKEPEELGYLFLTIAVGLGLGAGFQITTIIITLSILIYLYLSGEKQNKSKTNGEYTILLNIPNKNYNESCALIEKYTVASKIIKAETQDLRTSVYFNVSIDNNFNLQELIEKLKIIDEKSTLDFVESGVNW
ncbi:DUF4956 domain-containing protein [Candidatus Pelagibacter sp.]|nr:DUF4956 domain-containing protein [Candidatus Pelagibacter sp.]MDC0642200.1 DUF4956 domain-containing protein [Candidatus Pelagibacter sp.]